MRPLGSTIPPAAQPKYNTHFDTWNSSSTGHQHAENHLSGSTGWQQLRSTKITSQFRGGNIEGRRLLVKVGTTSEYRDQKANLAVLEQVDDRTETSMENILVSEGHPHHEQNMSLGGIISGIHDDDKPSDPKAIVSHQDLKSICPKRGIFDGLVIYINGSTYPLISDHKLKHLLVQNGGRISMYLARRQVTHVILGRPCGRENTSGLTTSKPGAGGGLAATKIQKEIKRVGGCGIRYVGAEWVLESIKSGKRVPEYQHSDTKVAAKSQKSVYDLIKAGNQNNMTKVLEKGCA